VRVLAAYEPVGVFGWGVVAKMDLTEVRAPFWTAALMAVLGSMLLMTGSILGLRRLRLTAVHRAQKIERRYRTILDQVPAGVLVGEAAITYANQAALRMLQTTLQQILGKRPWEIAPDVQRDGRPSREVARDVVAAARRGDRPRLTFTLRRDDGSTFTASADVARIEVDGETDLVASFQDVTDREAAEKDLRLLEQALNQAGEAVIITDAAARIEYVNPAFEKITGYTLAEALGKNPSILKSGQQDQAFYQKMWNELGRGGPVQRRFVNRRKDGSIYLQDSIIAPLLDRNGTAVNYVAVARDVTQLVGLEEERRQGQKLESIGQLTTGIAHDFNNLLTVMLANSELAVAAAAAGVPFPED
jgi:PAS domain S-box-containing protein